MPQVLSEDVVMEEATYGSTHLLGERASAAPTRGRRRVGVAILGLAFLATCAHVGRAKLGFDPYKNPNAPTVWKPLGPLLAPKPESPHDVTFILRTSCKTKEVKDLYSDFWLDGEKEAFIVKHNYGSDDFFTRDEAHAIKMERVILDHATGERGYRVTTNLVDFEFGFALRNKITGEWISEIGTARDHSPLFRDECVQRYGRYFNRVLTRENDQSHVEYVFGTCSQQCAAGHVDTAYKFRYSDDTIPASSSDAVLLTFKSNTAKLFTLHSAMMNGGGTGRGLAVRDTLYTGESDTSIRFIVAMISPYAPPDYKADFYGRQYVKMMSVHVERDPSDNTMRAYVGDAREHKLAAPCSGSMCSAGLYDIPALWHHPSQTKSWRNKDGSLGATLHNLEYTLGEKGDSRVAYFKKKYSDSAYLKDDILHAAGAWGADVDVRRVILQSGGSCGSAWWGGDCLRNWVARADESLTATANEKHWILVVLGGNACNHPVGGGCANMVRVKVSNKNGALRVQVLAGRTAVIQSQCPPSNYAGCTWDSVNIPNIGAYFDSASKIINVATSKTSPSNAYGVGFLNYAMAPEMVPSLSAPVSSATSSSTALLGLVTKELEQHSGSSREPLPGGEPPSVDELSNACLDGCSRVTVDLLEYALNEPAACADFKATDLSCFTGDNCVDVKLRANRACPGTFTM